VGLAACGNGRGGEYMAELPAKSELSTSALAGQTFVSADVDGEQLVEDTRITLTFTADTLSADAGCNTMHGSYTIDDDVLKVDAMVQTLMSCGPTLDAQDQWVAAFLQAGPTATLVHDVLTLEHDGTEVVLGNAEMKAL
jgi:heat shock protein HslJ